MRFLNVGDPQLGSLATLFGAEHGLRLQIEALERVFKTGQAENCRYAIVLGDVFSNPNPDQAHVSAFLRVCHKYAETMKIFIITGNHDVHSVGKNSLVIASSLDRLGVMPNLRVFLKPATCILQGVPVQFLPWGYNKPTPGRSLVFAHVTAQGARDDNGRIYDEGCAFSDEHYVISGHLHTFQSPHKNVFYPGTVLQFRFGETDKKFITVSQASITSTGRLAVTHQHYDAVLPYRLITVPVETLKDLDSVPAAPDGNLYRLALDGTVRLPDNWLAARPHVIRVIGKNRTAANAPATGSGIGVGIHDRILELAEKQTPPPLRATVMTHLRRALDVV